VRVLHTIEATGGVLSVVDQYVKWQIEAGDDVHLLLSKGVEYDRGTVHRWGPDRRTPHRWPSAIRALSQTIEEIRPDILHLHSFFPGLLGRMRALPASSRPAVVYQPHSWAFDRSPSPAGPALIGRWERFATRNTNGLIVNSEDEASEGARHGITMPATAVGVPVDLEHFTPATAEARDQARAEHDFGDRSVLLCVGRLTRQKGQDQLVAAWQQRPVPDAVLVLLGPGDPTYLQKLAGDEWGRSIIAPGTTDDVRPWLAAADLLVTASRWEGQAVSVAEALACGVPVVSTDVNGAHASISDGPEDAAGTVVPRGDMGAFMVACRRRVLEPALLEKEAAAARPRAVRMFDRRDVTLRVERAYREAIVTNSRSMPSGGSA
jgi:glycosyltransferase involved in cell wall biosynthesis